MTARETCRCGLTRAAAVHGNPFGAGHTFDPTPAASGGATDGERDETHVVDRDGNVWFLCPEYDRAMATRATATGPISAGIVALEAESGPLLPFDPIAYRRNYPRGDW